MRAGLRYGCGCLLAVPFGGLLLALLAFATGGFSDWSSAWWLIAGLIGAGIWRWVRRASGDGDDRLSVRGPES